ncbi:2,3-bisphosphoglycerate-independent phosphoglycerate mutase [Rufibacter latericius]|uniref:2,3-bisphosphoglycerate-independent phosphoglycerate mutase n=1 Tax=Rufibacter latericius TaxID=2487040 RepID=A0A3M9MDV0_9BACT|nr:2,3-bisphosphoglycerate-independent phosphoglycerate mutase [Rufibacter latericius]RNI23674.1 2,3-bisphosphoglycerate-independent phosphoglycerate mutase [Rufibacter latericius]
MSKKVLLMILDGWGLGTDPSVSAIEHANTPFMDSLFHRFPHARLQASGEAVGLPEGQMGNSEVGHMNLGAGRVVYQDLVKVNVAIREKTLGQNPVLRDAFQFARENGKPVHFIGLVSDGGVHSHIEHLKALCSLAQEQGLNNVFVHAFTDGRDTDPKGGLAYLTDLQNHLDTTGGKIASIIGRYYAMDRDNRWERVKLAYDLLVHANGRGSVNWREAIQESYDNGTTDEFIQPIVCLDENGEPTAKIQEGDVVICFNFRTDRGREITQALTQREFPEQDMYPLSLRYYTLTNYDDTFVGVYPIFDKDNLANTLGEVLANAGKTQIRIAETEKYPHVTFFFSGGREQPFEGEKRLLCPSPKVATYDMQPEMSAFDIRDAIVPEIEAETADFICLNFANPDMVGHTGVFEAAVKAVETVDQCTEAVVTAALAHGYTSIIIADHGNADMMRNPDGTPNTAHTTNLVPIILADEEYKGELMDGKLGDIAPTVLTLLGVQAPADMTGTSLLIPSVE